MMTYRFFRLHFVSTILGLTLASPRGALAQTPRVTFVSGFQIKECGFDASFKRNRLDKAVAWQDHVVAVCSSNPPSFDNRQLYILDDHGNNLAATDLGSTDVLDVVIRSTGRIDILSEYSSGGIHIDEFDQLGSKTSSVAVSQDWFRIVSVDDALYAMSRRGVIYRVAGGNPVIAQLPAAVYETVNLIAISAAKFAVVEKTSGLMNLVDVSTGVATVEKLSNAELGRVLDYYRHDRTVVAGARGLAVLGATADERHVFLLFSGFKAEDGAPLLILDAASLHELGLVRIPVKYGAGQNAVVPASLAASNGNVFLVDTGGYLARYSVH